MLANVVEWSIRNRFLVAAAALAAVAAGLFAVAEIPLDAIPDLSDAQVIVRAEYPGQAPRLVEDQVTYPLTAQLLSVPYAETVRGYSFFGLSLIYVIFEDGTDLYWARSRVLESLNFAASRLPAGVTPSLGPDATGVGWAFAYALRSDRHDLSELRSIQDWFLKYELSAVPGVAEVASIGGFVKQYQITLDPNKLRAYNLSISAIRGAVRMNNREVGGRVLEIAEKEFMIRGRGYFQSLDDIRQTALSTDARGVPILLRDVARVSVGPEMRRGLADWDGEGETVGGIVVVRSGANALQVIRGVKARLAELRPGLPDGVKIETAYDRSRLIERAAASLQNALTRQLGVVALVCVLFLVHFRSALVAVMALPVGILMAFAAMYWQGIDANIMSLGGIAVAVGTMVDAGIVTVENVHRRRRRDSGSKPHWRIVADASKEVAPSLFFSLLVIAVSFLPVFALEEQEGRLFRPLAFTKTYAMAAAALLSVTLTPVLAGWWVRGRILPEHKNPSSRLLTALYRAALAPALRLRWLTLAAAAPALIVAATAFRSLGSEFMPPLWEGDLLYMPTTLPGISIGKAREILQQTDRIIKTFPEVEHVFGKAGRAETATDPAPLSMLETTITLKPRSEWREGVTPEKLIRQMDAALQIPGLTNAWTMPVKTRIDMLATGIRTPVGVKIAGPDLAELERIGRQIERIAHSLPGTSSVYAERVMGGNYLDFEIDRREIARFGLTVGQVQEVIRSAIGGMNVAEAVEGRERYPINLRYARELRDDLPALRAVLVPTPAGPQVPLGRLAAIRYAAGPPLVKSENAKPNAWVHIDIRDVDVGSYVERARRAVAEQAALPAGYSLTWSGQFEAMRRTRRRLLFIVPCTLLAVFALLYLNNRSAAESLLVLAGVPFALTGAVWLLYALDYNLSTAVWVGMIALAGLYAETAIVMLLFLNRSCRNCREKGLLTDRNALLQAVYSGSLQRVRPIVMTVATDALGLLPILWSSGAGADVMKRIAAPLAGGIVTSGLTVLLLLPAAYALLRGRALPRGGPFTGFANPEENP